MFAFSSALTLLLILGSASDPRALLVGVWRIQEEIDTRADGSVVPVIPQGYAGQVIYTADGFMAATLMPRDRNWAVGTATAEQMRQTLEMGTAYAGRYEVDPKTHTVTHVVLTSMDPGDIGQRLSRSYALDGDSLSLSGKWTDQGKPASFTVKFTRAKAAP